MNKQIYSLIITLTCLLAFTGCSTTKTMTCKKTGLQDNASISTTYKVKYSGEIVHSIYSVEEINSTDSSFLDDYEKRMTTIYSPYLGIKYYNFNIENKNNKVIVTVDVNYDKVDIEKLKKIDSSNESLFTNGKVNINTIKSLYNNIGVTCNG